MQSRLNCQNNMYNSKTCLLLVKVGILTYNIQTFWYIDELVSIVTLFLNKIIFLKSHHHTDIKFIQTNMELSDGI